MSKLRNGLLGKSSGKIGGIVTANWKGINYAREYVVPANPRSEAQTTRRTVFANLVFIGRQVKTTFVDTYWNNLFKGKSTTGFAQFIGYNQKQITTVEDLNKVKMATGDLETVKSLTITKDSANDKINLIWSSVVSSNGKLDDLVYIYAYVPERNFLYTPDLIVDRDSEESSIVVPGLSSVSGDIFVFVTLIQGANVLFSTTEGIKL